MGSITLSSDSSSDSISNSRSSSISSSICSCISPYPPYPLHSSILPKLDLTYTSFYNKHLINNQVVHHQPLQISRSSSILLPGASDPLPVGEILDLNIPFDHTGTSDNGRETEDGEDVESKEVYKTTSSRTPEREKGIDIRVFIPKGEKPDGGWPLCMYFHGGGWVLGGIDTENTVCTNLCQRGEVVVVSVDYRYDYFPITLSFKTCIKHCQKNTSMTTLHPRDITFPRTNTPLPQSRS